MPPDLRVFVNERGVDLPAGARVRDAIRLALPELVPECDARTLLVTDARGLPADLDTLLVAGLILRARAGSRASDTGV